jgi:hypothetical protein
MFSPCSPGVVFANKGGMWYQNGQVGLLGVSGSNGMRSREEEKEEEEEKVWR